MGTVYRAQQDEPERDVAIKVIRAERLSAATRRRFRTEARILGDLDHPGIVPVFEAGRSAAHDNRTSQCRSSTANRFSRTPPSGSSASRHAWS